MRAVVIEEPGGPEQLHVAAVDSPIAAAGQVLVDVRAAGVNYADVLVRLGRYPTQPPFPCTPGLEVAGDCDGRRVVALTGLGGYAERVAVDPAMMFDLPEALGFEEGAGFLLTFLTAWIALERHVRLGMTVLVTAAAGGVGTSAIQVARQLGARVIAAASGTERLAACRELGAEILIDYSTDDLRGATKAAGGADVALDMVGGETLRACIDGLRARGTAIAVGAPGGVWEPVDPALLVGRNIALEGVFLSRLVRFEPTLVQQAARTLIDLWAAGAIAPRIGAVLPFEAADVAHRLLEERRNVGKVVLVP